MPLTRGLHGVVGVVCVVCGVCLAQVLCTIFAEAFANVSDAIEAGGKPADIAAGLLEKHWKVIFNGNGYSEEWPIEAGKRGIWRIDSGVESMAKLSDAKNTALFEKMYAAAHRTHHHHRSIGIGALLPPRTTVGP
jgi:glutamine synthetase type III